MFNEDIVDIKDLVVEYSGRRGGVRAVDHVDLR